MTLDLNIQQRANKPCPRNFNLPRRALFFKYLFFTFSLIAMASNLSFVFGNTLSWRLGDGYVLE